MKQIALLILIQATFTVQAQSLDVEVFATNIITPTTITNANDDRLFVTEKSGQVRIINANGTVGATPFLDISALISNGSEQGLLGLAFHPNYQTNGFLYVSYTNLDGDSVIARYSRNTQNTANPSSATILITIDQFASNHNGGTILFGPDNKLYFGVGDGGGGGDPQKNGQNINTKLATILRLDVDIPAPYIPTDNPFIGINGDDAVWMYGLRNPWKFSFDNSDLWIADVGDNGAGDEEINRVIGNTPAINFGWSCYEGEDTQDASQCSGTNGLTFPVATYNRTSSPNRRCSVTGGNVYRGSRYPSLIGKYIFGDACSDELLLIDPSTNINSISFFDDIFTDPSSTFFTGALSFGVDMNNELFVGASDRIYRIIDTNTLSISEFEKNKAPLIYPNPTKESFTLNCNSKIISLEIYTAGGALVKTASSEEKNKGIYNVNNLSAGLYYIKATKLNEKTTHKLILK